MKNIANNFLYKKHKRNERKEEYPIITRDKMRANKKKEVLCDQRTLEWLANQEEYRILNRRGFRGERQN